MAILNGLSNEPKQVWVKTGEKEDNALSSEILEEKVTELLGNKVKHVESSSQVAETVNTQVEAGIPTNESGTFFQALSDLMVTSKSPESFDAATTKDQDPELVKTSESVEYHTEQIRPSDQIEEKTENQELNDRITTDVCVLTPIEAKGENEEKNDEKAIEKEACEDKDESAAGLKYLDSMAPSKQQGDQDCVTSTQDGTSEDIKETTSVAGIKEQDFYERPREFVKQETEDKSIDTQEAIEQWESLKKIEQEEETEEIRPSVEIEEKKDAITTDTCISTQTKYQVEITEHEEKDEEAATQSDDGQKQNSDIPSIKDVWEENSSEKVEYESYGMKLNEKAIAILNKDEEREQEVTVLEKDQGEDIVASSQDVSFEGNEREVVMGKEEDTEEIRSSVETTGVCISTQTKPEEETTKNNEKNIESDDGLMKKSGSHMVKEVCEDIDSEKTECEEGLKPLNNSSILLNENEVANKDEDQEKEQELYVSEKEQTESQVKTTKLEEGNEDVTESDDSQKDNSDSLTIKEVCEQTNSEKVESERVELFDSSSIKINDKDIALVSNDEVEDKEQDQGEDAVKLCDGINTDVCVSTQAELVKETIENEDKNDEKAIEKEICEDISPEKAESEVGLQLSDSIVPSKKNLNTLEKDQGNSDGVTSSQDTTCEDTRETTPSQYAATVADFKDRDLNEEAENFVKEETEDKSVDAQQASEECENGINAIPTNVCISTQTEPEETTETQEKKDEEAIENDDGQTKSGIPMVEEICEEIVLEKDESEEGLKLSNSTSLAQNENEIVSKDENQEKVQELNVTEKDQSSGDDVTSSQNASNEDKETTTGHVTTVVDLEEEAEDKAIDAQEASAQYEDRGNDNREQNPEDSVNDIVHSCSKIEHEEYTEEIKPSVETNEEKNVCISTQTESQEVAIKNEEKADDPFMKEVCEETDLKKTESEEIKLSDNSKMNLNEKAIEIMSKDEDQENEHEPKTAVFEDELHGENNDGEYNELEIFQTRESIKGDNEDIRASDETEEKMEQQGSLHAITSDVSILAQREFQEETTKNEEKNEEAIESDDGWKEKSAIPSDKKDCEETSLEKVKSEEEIELHGSSNTKITDKIITSKDEDQEKDQKVNMSGEGQDKDDVTTSQVAAFIVEEEDLQEKNYHNEGDVKIREVVDEDSKEIKSSNETKENSEQQGLSHIITTDVCRLTQTEPIEETTENEEKNDKEAIENDDDRTKKPENSLVKEICEATISEKANSEEGVEHYDSSSTTLIENETESKEEKLEKEQELKISDLQGGEDDVISSHNASIQDIKEIKTGNRAMTVAYFEEGKGASAMTEEIIMEEAEDKSVDAQEKAEPTTEIKQETFEEGCEETSSEKAELEGLKLSDSSDIKINEEVMTALYNDDQEVNISTENQSKDNVTSLNDTTFEEEDLQEKNYQNEINEREFDKTRESLNEDTKEIKSSVETKEHKSEIPLFKVVCEAKSLEMTESEDGVKHSEIFNTKLEENEIVSKEENLEKEQELIVSEVQGGGDDLTGSDNVSNKDIKETNIGQRATTVVNFEEGQELSAMPKDILVEEAEDKSNDAQQASEQRENEAKNKSKQNPKDIVNEPLKPCAEIVEGKLTEDDTYAGNDKEIEVKLEAENQVERTEDRSEMKDEVVSTEKITSELGQPKEQNTEETEACLTKTTTEKTEDEITKGEEDSSHESTEHTNDNITREEICTLEPVENKNGGMDEVSTENLTNLYETTAVEPQEDITPSNSLGTSTEDVSNSEKAKAESENLPIEDLESVSEVQIPEVVPKSEDVKVKEECLMSEAATKEILSDEDPEPYGERKLTYESATDDHINETTQQAERSCIPTEENVTGVEEISESDSPYVKRDMEEVGTQKNQLTSKEDSSEMVKDVTFTEEVPSDIHKEHEINDFKEQTVEEDSYSKIQNEMAHEISYSDSIPVRNPEVTEVRVDTQIGQEYLQAAEDISYESKVKNDSVDEAPKEEIIPSLEEVKTIEPEVDLSNIELTAYPSENKESPTPDLDSVSDVQPREISDDSEVRKVKEERIALATAQHMDENKVEEEQKNNTNEILSVPDTEEENVKHVPAKSDEEKSDFNSEERDVTIENLKLHGELEPTSESVIEEDQVNKIKPQPEQFDITSENIMNEIKPQPEQFDITSENIMNDQESKLEHKSEKDLEDDLKFGPENQIKNIENQDEIRKNVILTDEASQN